MLFTAAPGLAFFDCGGVRLMLSISQGEESDQQTPVIYYKVADIHAAFAALGEKQVVFTQPQHLVAKMPDHELWIGFIRDPDLNLIGIMAELPLS